jgi:uncharacterized protein with von Willebrand factor type A (vWA) domain
MYELFMVRNCECVYVVGHHDTCIIQDLPRNPGIFMSTVSHYTQMVETGLQTGSTFAQEMVAEVSSFVEHICKMYTGITYSPSADILNVLMYCKWLLY